LHRVVQLRYGVFIQPPFPIQDQVAFFIFSKKFFYFALPIGFSQWELVKGLFLNSD